MKYYIIDENEAPLYWAEGDEVAHIMEFDTEDDALEFLYAAKQIPFFDLTGYDIFVGQFSLPGSRNYSGFIPVANGDNIDLVRRETNETI